MALKVTYKGTDIIDETADCVKKLDTAGCYMEDDVTIDYTGGTAPTLISKSITANGTYNASSDNADGYSSVTVNVPDNVYEKFDELMSGTIKYIKSSANNSSMPRIIDKNNGQIGFSNLEFFSMKNAFTYLASYCLSNSKVKYFRVDRISALEHLCASRTTSLKSFIMTSANVAPANNSSIFDSGTIDRGTGFVYVLDSLVSTYKTASNWTRYANQIKGFSEASVYDATTTYEIGDVCKYNNKFYGYCKKDLTSSTGNAPSGTTSDNDYWEYVADIVTA